MVPLTDAARLLVASEAMIGVVLAGVFLAALATDRATSWDEPFDLTGLVKGKARCWVRVRCASALDRDVAVVHGVWVRGTIE